MLWSDGSSVQKKKKKNKDMSLRYDVSMMMSFPHHFGVQQTCNLQELSRRLKCPSKLSSSISWAPVLTGIPASSPPCLLSCRNQRDRNLRWSGDRRISNITTLDVRRVRSRRYVYLMSSRYSILPLPCRTSISRIDARYTNCSIRTNTRSTSLSSTNLPSIDASLPGIHNLHGRTLLLHSSRCARKATNCSCTPTERRAYSLISFASRD
jgi:hypothetical protein